MKKLTGLLAIVFFAATTASAQAAVTVSIDGNAIEPQWIDDGTTDGALIWSGNTLYAQADNVTLSTPYDAIDFYGQPYISVNGNKAYFNPEDLIVEPFEYYSELDNLGRCGTAYANVCKDIMPTEKRESISSVHPSGWHNEKYDGIGYVYNRCHLIGFQLAGENANEQNLITGTRYFNVTGMLPFENMVADYVDETNNHVLYRVTPIYTSDNLVADGVEIEAYSVEDNGEGVSFNVYCYNVQPGVYIDYYTGENHLAE